MCTRTPFPLTFLYTIADTYYCLGNPQRHLDRRMHCSEPKGEDRKLYQCFLNDLLLSLVFWFIVSLPCKHLRVYASFFPRYYYIQQPIRFFSMPFSKVPSPVLFGLLLPARPGVCSLFSSWEGSSQDIDSSSYYRYVYEFRT